MLRLLWPLKFSSQEFKRSVTKVTRTVQNTLFSELESLNTEETFVLIHLWSLKMGALLSFCKNIQVVTKPLATNDLTGIKKKPLVHNCINSPRNRRIRNPRNTHNNTTQRQPYKTRPRCERNEKEHSCGVERNCETAVTLHSAPRKTKFSRIRYYTRYKCWSIPNTHHCTGIAHLSGKLELTRMRQHNTFSR